MSDSRFLRSCPSFRASWGAAALTLAMALSGLPASAQEHPGTFPAEATRFLDTEWPGMMAAVAAQDRSHFEGVMARTVTLAERWGFKSRANPELVAYGACTDAVSDLVVVGLCRLMPQAGDCTPELASKFERDRASCRAQAGR